MTRVKIFHSGRLEGTITQVNETVTCNPPESELLRNICAEDIMAPDGRILATTDPQFVAGLPYELKGAYLRAVLDTP